MVPVVVVGSDLNTLGVVRSFARSGIPVFVASDTRWSVPGFSRFATMVRVPNLQDRDLVEGLKRVAQTVGEKAVLILSGDQQVTAVSAAREELESLFYIDLPSKESVHLLGDKARFQSHAESLGLPVPRTVVLGQGNDVRALEALSMPAVVKPADKALVLAGLVQRAVHVETHEEARSVASEMLLHASCVIVQEWIDGEDPDIYFTLFVCDPNSRIAGLFSGRKLICTPPRVGSTALCIQADDQDGKLAELTERLVEPTKYRGIGGLEVKLNRRTNQYVIIEPTVGRTDWQEEIATLCGLNLPLIAYWTSLGDSSRRATTSLRRVAWRSSISFRPPAGLLPHGTRIFDGYFRLDDPLPGLYYYIVTAFFSRIAGLVLRLAGLR